MKPISSRANPLYRRLQRLAAGHLEREHEGETQRIGVLLEGVHLCQAWLEHHGLPEVAVFDAERLLRHTELQSLADAVYGTATETVSLPSALARGLSQVPQGQGVFFVVGVPTSRPLTPPQQNCLWLDRVQDPGNVGTLLRTAAAAGIHAVYLSTGCAAAWSPKVLRSAQGAHFVLEIHENVQLAQEAGRLTLPLLVTALEGAEPLYERPLPAHCVWVAGNEGGGVSPHLLERADRRVFIPQMPRVESLNVAVAMGICLFEQCRQHGLPAAT